MSTIIGKVAVKVFPDTSKFRKELKAELSNIGDVDIAVTADTAKMKAEVKAAAKSVAGDKINLNVGLQDGFLGRMQAELKAAASAMEAEIPLSVEGEGMRRDAAAEIAGLQAQIDRMKVRVPLDVESAATEKAELAAAIEALQAQAKASPITVKVKTDRSNLDQLEDALLGFRDRVGKIFGHGARNNFLNLLGAGMRNLSLAITGPILAMSSLVRAVQTGIQVFGEMREAGASLARSIGGGLMQAFTSLLSSLPALVVGLAGMVAAITLATTIVPFLTMALGALFALLSTVAMAIVGSLAPLVPLLAALAAGAGVAAGAVAMIFERIKEGKGAFAGVHKEVEGLKSDLKSIGNDIAPSLAKAMNTVLGGVRATVREMGPVIGKLIDDLNSKLDDPRMNKFYDQWQRKMPSIVSNFGKGLNSLALALVAFFAPVLDIADELAVKFKNAMDRFLDWTTSAKGQNSIKNFFEDAWKAAKLVWQTIKDVTVALGNMIFQANDTSGMGFFETLDKWMQKLRQWVKDPVKVSDLVDTGVAPGVAKAGGMPGSPLATGKSPFRSFMEDVNDFAGSLRKAAEDLGDLLAELNKPENRTRALDLADAFLTIADALKAIVKQGEAASKYMSGDLEGGAKSADESGLPGTPGWLAKKATELGVKVRGSFDGGFNSGGAGNGIKSIDMLPILRSGLGKAYPFAQEGGGKVSGNLAKGITDAMGLVSSAGATIGTSALTSVGNLIPGFNLKGMQGGGGLASGLGGASGIVGLAANALGLGALTSVGTLVPGFNVKGSEGGGGLASGLRSALGVVGIASGSLVGKADEKAVMLQAKMRDAGNKGAAGMGTGLRNGQTQIGSAVATLKTAAVTGMGGFAASMKVRGTSGGVAVSTGLRSGQGATKAAAGTLKAAGITGMGGFTASMKRKGSAGGSGTASGVRGAQGSVKAAAGTLKAASMNGLGGIEASMRRKGSDGGQGTASGISGKSGSVKAAAGTLKASGVGGLSGLPGDMKRKGSEGGQGTASGISGARGSVSAASQDIKGAATSPLSGLGSTLVSAGSTLIGGFISGITSRFGDVSSALGRLTSKLPSWKGPPKRDKVILTPAGHDVIDGFIRGLKGGEKDVKKTLNDLTDRLPDWKGPKKKDLKILRKSGRAVMRGFEYGLRRQSEKVKAALKELTKEIPKQMSGGVLERTAARTVKTLRSQMKQWDKLNKSYKKYAEKAKEYRQAKLDFSQGMLNTALGIGSLENIEDGFDEVLYRLKTARKMTSEFRQEMTKLRELGLRDDLYAQIAELGPEQGLAAARAIAGAGKKGVEELNKIQNTIVKRAGRSANESASHLYDAGIEMANNFANGFARSMNTLEARMLKIAKQMGRALNHEFVHAGVNGRIDTYTQPNSGAYTKITAPGINGPTNILNYYAAPGSQSNNESKLFDAFRRVGFK